MKYKKILKCRSCNSRYLNSFFDFGKMSLSTEFPIINDKGYKKIPMHLISCRKCKLMQLKHNYELTKLYNSKYGYKSGINLTMINHLSGIVKDINRKINISKNDVVLDIASNDGTLLSNYNRGVIKIGIDPILNKYKSQYPKDTKTASTFFSKKKFYELSGNKKAKAITSIAVFYDIQEPKKFVSDIKSILSEDGIWVIEQSYFPALYKNNAYDSLCHEHLTYFAFKQMKEILKIFELEVFDITFNYMNGGSIRYFIKHSDNKKIKLNLHNIKKVLNEEKKFYINYDAKLKKFKKIILLSKTKLIKLVKKILKQKKSIHIYGASTKGNIILQFCKFSKKEIPFAAERNEEKFGRKTPGTGIPIISEEVSRKMKPDYYLVMPWHFKSEILKREKIYIKSGGRLIFPLPKIEIIKHID